MLAGQSVYVVYAYPLMNTFIRPESRNDNKQLQNIDKKKQNLKCKRIIIG